MTKTHVVWKSRFTSYVPTPLIDGGKLYWVNDRGIAYCIDAETAELVYQERLSSGAGGGAARPFYASVVLAGGNLYSVSRTGGVYVFGVGKPFKQATNNRLAADKSDFNATPAISNGQLFLRSNEALYCIEAAK